MLILNFNSSGYLIYEKTDEFSEHPEYVTAVTVLDVKLRLKGLGFTLADNDDDLIKFCFKKAVSEILSFCNIFHIPDGLSSALTDKICALFLTEKKNTGGLDDFDYSSPVTRLKMGDTEIGYASPSSGLSTDDERFKELMDELAGDDYLLKLLPYRRLRF